MILPVESKSSRPGVIYIHAVYLYLLTMRPIAVAIGRGGNCRASKFASV